MSVCAVTWLWTGFSGRGRGQVCSLVSYSWPSELAQARQAGQELRFYKEKQEILSLALSQASTEELQAYCGEERKDCCRKGETALSSFMCRDHCVKGSTVDPLEQCEFYYPESGSDRESLG